MSHKRNSLEQVHEFMSLGKQTINENPTLVDNKLANFRVSLIQEEAKELFEALAEGNIVEVLDALCDLQYVLDGAFQTFGMAEIKEEAMDAVHASNMSKFCKSEEEALATKQFYAKQNVATYYKLMGSRVGVTTVLYWVVYRESDNKILKSINYQPVTEKLKKILKVQ